MTVRKEGGGSGIQFVLPFFAGNEFGCPESLAVLPKVNKAKCSSKLQLRAMKVNNKRMRGTAAIKRPFAMGSVFARVWVKSVLPVGA